MKIGYLKGFKVIRVLEPFYCRYPYLVNKVEHVVPIFIVSILPNVEFGTTTGKTHPTLREKLFQIQRRTIDESFEREYI